MREIKAFPLKMKGVGESGEFTGYASTFGDVDHGGDVVERGAFRKTLRENGGKIPVLDHHDPARQIGWNLEAREDERGLFVRGLLDLNVRAARERHSLMKMAHQVGARTGLSIGFRTVKEEPDRNTGAIRRLKEIKLFEYSIVTFPMNPQAAVTSIKAKQQLLDQFLRFEMGLDASRAGKAWHYFESLLEREPETHSPIAGADGFGSGEEPDESLLLSLQQLLFSFQNS